MADTGSEGPPNAAPATSVGGDSTPSVDAVGGAAAIAAQAGRGVHNAPQSAKYQDGGESLNVARYVVRKFLAGEGVPDDAEVTLTLHNYFYNVMHRVRVAGREGSYALRVSNENAFGRTLTNARSELAWLAALHAAQAETGVPVPRPVSTREGEYVISVAAGEGGSTRDRRCVMVEWLPGTLRYKVVTPALCEQAGRVMASLHKHVQGWAPPTWFELKPLEVLMSGPPYPTEGTRASSPPASDGTATTCAGAGGTAGAGAGTAASGVDAASGKKLSPLVVDPTPAQIEMIKQATAFSEATLAACTKAGPAFGGTIHADLHFGNMLVRDDEVIQVGVCRLWLPAPTKLTTVSGQMLPHAPARSSILTIAGRVRLFKTWGSVCFTFR